MRHGDVERGVHVAVGVDVVTVGILDGDAVQAPTRRVGERDGAVRIASRHVGFAADVGPIGAWTHGGDVDGVGVLDSIAVEIFAAGVVVFALVERVVIILQRGVLVANPLVVLRVVHRHSAVEGDVLDGSIVAAGNAAHAGIATSVLYIGRHTAVLNFAATFIQAGNAAQVGIVRAVVAAFNVAAHPAVLNGAFVLAADTAHLSRITHFDIAVHMKVLHFSIFPYSIKQALIVVAAGAIIYFDFDSVAFAVECHIKAKTSAISIMTRIIISSSRQWYPISGSHIEIGINVDILITRRTPHPTIILSNVNTNTSIIFIHQPGHLSSRVNLISNMPAVVNNIARLSCRHAIPDVEVLGSCSLCKRAQQSD